MRFSLARLLRCKRANFAADIRLAMRSLGSIGLAYVTGTAMSRGQRKANVRLDEAVAELEAGFAQVVRAPDAADDGDWSRCRTGEPFLTVVSYGVLPRPASPIERSYDGPAEAIAAWLETARKATEGKRGTLYWRHPAEVDRTSDGKWIVYSRFVSTEA